MTREQAFKLAFFRLILLAAMLTITGCTAKFVPSYPDGLTLCPEDGDKCTLR